jgi:Domain of unknown function (DUF4326)
MPKRIQRKRTKGWKMPEGAVSVTRRPYGNPFDVGQYCMRGDFRTVAGQMAMIYTCTTKEYADSRYTLIATPKEAVEWFRWYVGRTRKNFPELRGKDLVCWCPLNRPCHADVLLEIANA